MNKKFLSAILFGALMVTSTGTFVSCKDYDDEIKDLQTQIDNLATKSDVEAKLSQLQAAITAAKAEAEAAAKNATAAELAALKAEIAALGDLEAKIDAMLATVQEAVDADMAEYKTEIAALIEQAEALVGEVADYVTSVELNYQGENEDYSLEFYTLKEKGNVFEEGLTGAITFEEGRQTNEGQTPVIVRVSPTNAVLAPEMISLVNSKGENLDEYVEFKVEKYTGLLSRAATNNGLWEITPIWKELDKDNKNYLAKQLVKVNDANEYIQYAIQVNNSIESAEARYVTSAYDITLGEWDEFDAEEKLLFTVDGVSVEELNNRYAVDNNPSLPKFDASKFDGKVYAEHIWLGNAATAPIWETKDKLVKNVKPGDDRHTDKLALAVQGKAMTIAISDGKDDNSYEGRIKGLYVTLDYEANAVESAPSEWNAWNEYDITGLNTVVEGTSTTITIDGEETINDIIGFRVYAVNLDGTLVDPDGRAFYVLVGEQAAETQTVTATITPVNYSKDNNTTVTKDLTEAQSAVITSLLNNQKNNPSVAMADNKPIAVDAEGDTYPVTYNVEFNWNSNKTKVVSATFKLTCDIKNLINDQIYKAFIVYKNAENGHILGEVNFELTKTMPTAFPTDFAFRPKQETEDGNGKFIAYMNPVNGYAVTTPSGYGVKDLDNVFYGLDDYFKFVFATSAADTDKDGVLNTVTVTDTDDTVNEKGIYNLTVSENETDGYFIDNKTSHAVSVYYTYPGISTKKVDGKDYYEVGATHDVPKNATYEAVYACWEDASAFAWGTYVPEGEKATVSRKPALQWTADAVDHKAELKYIVSTNSYDNKRFGLDLESLVVTEQWLEITDIKLTVGEQVNPYFAPEHKGSEIIFNQIKQQEDAAPTADHEETLVVTVKDAYGHKTTFELPVTVKAPEKK